MKRSNYVLPSPTSSALAEGAITLDDEQLTRELRSIARTYACKDQAREERVASRLLRLACLWGMPTVREHLNATMRDARVPGARAPDDEHDDDEDDSP